MIDLDAKVYIVDDDSGARASVKSLVESHGMRTETHPSAESFYEAIAGVEDRCGCIVTDVRMKGMSGLELQQRLNSEAIDLPVVIITAYANIPMAVQAVQAGAVDFLMKPCEPDRLWATILRALEKDAARRLEKKGHARLRGRLASLTTGECAVLGKVMEGLPNKRIARDLDIGLRTVELRRANIMKKMAVESLAELIQSALAAGFQTVLPDDPVQ